jgi:hypothetical protein
MPKNASPASRAARDDGGMNVAYRQIRAAHDDEARELLPAEAPYPLRSDLAARIGSAEPAIGTA